ncbi:NDR1/HIN1-like protein 6 isoform X2 [Magnolia sinica]|uniref:NDR1/HIN1-like protein 6 isoform X2 n=1 Tax=Magnolia sinica TaxID=86752 RepID=UPI0026581477|nr:NDR1/HIN1-like protein 6 isoform X2 [Magnolia sinica]
MADPSNPKPKPILQKPPGYKDPNKPLISKPPTRKAPIHPAYHQKQKRKSCCCCCCCFMFIFILLLIIIVAIAGGLFYLWFKPKLPSFQLQSLETPKFKVDVRPDGTFLDSQTVIRVQARNPNSKIGFSYGKTQVRISAVGVDGVGLGSGSLAGFEQGTRNVTVLKFSTAVKNQLIEDGAGKRLKARYQSKQLAFDVEVRTRFGLRLWGWETEKLGVRVLCEDVRMRKSTGGASPKCKINTLKWINIS